MASPLRPDPNEPRRSYEELERERLARERINRLAYGTGAFAWWWVFWIIVIAIAIWWAGWGWGGSGSLWWGGRGRTVPYGNTYKGMGVNGNTGVGATSGPGWSALTATDKQPYIGKPFQVNNVPVQKKISDTVFLVGPKNTTPTLLVVKTKKTVGITRTSTAIDAGTLIDITGTVQKAPPPAQAQNEWRLSGEEATQLAGQGGYIESSNAFYVPR